ncbi:MAG: serine hydroxymethyltransferase [Nitrospirae bacterium]|nr:serine hydroxymethyltransferase [Nitrospirota bacterium]NTW66956.1 serine hydroxymethyltransferase [Nitrospirota bacterium]
MSELQDTDIEVYNAIQSEEQRELTKILLIASENCVSKAVLEAQGSVFTNKYAEGYPNRRYYGGCEFADRVETLALERARQLFGCEHVNVQPHSGSSANMAVYFSVLQPGDTILGMALPHGGHLTHGASVSFSGQLYKSFSYGVDKTTELLDYDQLERLAVEHKPKMIVAGYSAYSRAIDFARFRRIADKVGAYLMADIAHIAGLVAAGEHPSPVPHADFVTTTTHKTLRGPRGGMIMCKEKFAKAVDKVIFPGIQGGPLVHVIAAKAVSFKEALMPEFRDYQRQVVKNAKALAKRLTEDGFRIVSGGTDNHLMLVDLTPKNITGRDAEIALDAAGITVNKNSIPYDQKPPVTTSGIRLGTPLVTTRGMREPEMKIVGDLICEALANIGDSGKLASIKQRTKEFCGKYPMFAMDKVNA